jgi:hypothetical protein
VYDSYGVRACIGLQGIYKQETRMKHHKHSLVSLSNLS